MLTEIIQDLGEMFRIGDEQVLQNILDDVTANALSISKNTIDNVKDEIKLCVKQKYQNRGLEGYSSSSSNGESSKYIDPDEQLRKNIIKNGKRRLF